MLEDTDRCTIMKIVEVLIQYGASDIQEAVNFFVERYGIVEDYNDVYWKFYKLLQEKSMSA